VRRGQHHDPAPGQGRREGRDPRDRLVEQRRAAEHAEVEAPDRHTVALRLPQQPLGAATVERRSQGDLHAIQAERSGRGETGTQRVAGQAGGRELQVHSWPPEDHAE
jgi:hypothetical protein